MLSHHSTSYLCSEPCQVLRCACIRAVWYVYCSMYHAVYWVAYVLRCVLCRILGLYGYPAMYRAVRVLCCVLCCVLSCTCILLCIMLCIRLYSYRAAYHAVYWTVHVSCCVMCHVLGCTCVLCIVLCIVPCYHCNKLLNCLKCPVLPACI